MTTLTAPKRGIPLAVQRQAKAFLGGAVAAVAAAEAPLVQGGHWSLNTLYAAAVSAVVGYALVYLKTNTPTEITAVEKLLGALVERAAPVPLAVAPHVPAAFVTHAATTTSAVPVAVVVTPAPVEFVPEVAPPAPPAPVEPPPVAPTPVAPAPVVAPVQAPASLPAPAASTPPVAPTPVAYTGPVPPVSAPVGATAAPTAP